MTTDTRRAAFEAWATHPDRHGKLPIEAHANGAYKDSRTYTAYYGWISAIASMEATEPAAWISPAMLEVLLTHPSGHTVLCGRRTSPGRTIPLFTHHAPPPSAEPTLIPAFDMGHAIGPLHKPDAPFQPDWMNYRQGFVDGKAEAQQVAVPQTLPTLADDERSALLRFAETCDDGQEYDVPNAMMQRLAKIGVVRRVTVGIYETTHFGEALLAAATQPPQGEVK